MTIYLAAPWSHKEQAKAMRDKIQAAGITVLSRWLDFAVKEGDAYSQEVLTQEAQNDVADLMFAEALVVLNYAKSEGKACETGMALILGIPVISVHEGNNVFLNLPQVRRVGSVDEAIAILSKSL